MPVSRTEIDDLVALAPDREPDLPARVGVLGRVVQQVGEDLGQADGIALERRAARAGASTVSWWPRRLDQRPARLDRAADDGGQLDRLLAQLDLAAVMRETSSRSSTSRTMWLTCRSIISPTRSAVGSCWPVEPQDVQRVADRRERVAQLVGEHGEELVLAAVGLAQRRARCARCSAQVRSRIWYCRSPRPQRRAHRADQRRHPHRPLQHGDVAEQVHRLGHRGGVGPGPREHQHRQVGPRRLAREPLGQAVVAARRDRLFGQQHRAGAGLQLRRRPRPGRRSTRTSTPARLEDRRVSAASLPVGARTSTRCSRLSRSASGHGVFPSRDGSPAPRRSARRSARRGSPAAARRR